MFFSREDILKIQKALTELSIKDSEMPEAYTPFNIDDTISIVQKGYNKKISVKEFIDQLQYIKKEDDFVNITDTYDESFITLEEAIQLIPEVKRKKGLVITFQDTDGNWQMYQFRGELNQWNVTGAWKDLYDFEEYIVNSVLPDEEDLTKVLVDSKGNYAAKLKDRAYDPENFSGLGRVILRKNIIEVEDPEYGIVKKNILQQDMINQANTIYEIRYDFNLNNQTITIPEGCVLDFQGGSLHNGTLGFNSTIIRNSTIQVFYDIIFTGLISGQVLVDWFCQKLSAKAGIVENILRTSNVVKFDVGSYEFDRTIYVNNEGSCFLQGVGRDKTILNFPEDGITFVRTYWWSNNPIIRDMTIYAKRDCIVLNARPSVNTTPSTVQQGLFEHLSLSTYKGYCIYFYLGPNKEKYTNPFGNTFNDIVLKRSWEGGTINYNPYIYGIMGLQNTFINIRDTGTPQADYPVYTQNTLGTFRDCNIEFTSYHRKFICIGKWNEANNQYLNEEDNINITDEGEGNSEVADLRIINCNIEDFLEHPILYNDYTPMSLYLENSTIAVWASQWTWYYWAQAKVISYIGSKDLKFKGTFTPPGLYVKLASIKNAQDLTNKLSKIRVDTDNVCIQTDGYGIHLLSGASPFITFPLTDNFINYRNISATPNGSSFNHFYVPVYNEGKFNKSDYNLNCTYSYNKVRAITQNSDTLEFKDGSLFITIPEGRSLSIKYLPLDNSDFKIPIGTILYFQVNNGSLTIINNTDRNSNDTFYIPNYQEGENLVITYGSAAFQRVPTPGLTNVFKWVYKEDLSSSNVESLNRYSLLTSNNTGTYNSNKASFGQYQFSTALNRAIYRIGASTWVDANGDACALKKGTTAERPTSVNEGFEYYDSSLKKKILWNGSAWVNIDGTSLS